VERTAFVDNVSDGQGGGVWLDGQGPFLFENVLFSGNQATGDRGGGATFNIPKNGAITLSHVTFVDNGAKNGCGAFWLPGAGLDVHLRNSLIAFNKGANKWEEQTGYPPIDDGGNLQWPKPSAGDPAVGPASLLDPKLGPLLEQDGTWLRVPQPGSPAMDAGLAPAPATDQRGAPRSDGKPDAGSVEVGAACGGE
jgi:hypothetical protein